MKYTSIVFLLSLFVATAFCDDEKMEKQGGGGPCREIKKACKAAGFQKGGHKEGKGLYKDCLKPILEGKTVAGVTVDNTVVQACKEKKMQHHHKKEMQ